jgi:hypothetical protein
MSYPQEVYAGGVLQSERLKQKLGGIVLRTSVTKNLKQGKYAPWRILERERPSHPCRPFSSFAGALKSALNSGVGRAKRDDWF